MGDEEEEQLSGEIIEETNELESEGEGDIQIIEAPNKEENYAENKQKDDANHFVEVIDSDNSDELDADNPLANIQPVPSFLATLIPRNELFMEDQQQTQLVNVLTQPTTQNNSKVDESKFPFS